MNDQKFMEWLSSIAIWERPVPRDGSGRPIPIGDREPQTGPVIEKLKTCEQKCEWCDKSCNDGNHKRYTREYDKKSKSYFWRWFCESCKKRYDPETGHIGVSTGSGFIKQGVRVPAPGKKLGRPPGSTAKKKAWWNVGNEVAADPRCARERMADILDAREARDKISNSN